MDGSPQVVRFDATTLWHLDAAEWAPSTASFTSFPSSRRVRSAPRCDAVGSLSYRCCGRRCIVEPILFSAQGAEQRTQGRRARLPATTCQRSARASCYRVRFQFGPRGCDTYPARLPQRPSRSHLGHQIHQTYCLPTSSAPPSTASVACCAHRFKTLIYLKGFGVGTCGALVSTSKVLALINKP